MEFMLFLSMLGTAMIFGLIPAYIAKSKGRDFSKWWLYGTLIFIVALPHAVFIKTYDGPNHLTMQSGQKKCPHCAEFVKADAKLCRFCQKEFATGPVKNKSAVRHRSMSNGDWVCGRCDELNNIARDVCKSCNTSLNA